jgi:hypothetical protein
MKTSWTETQQIESHLHLLDEANAPVFEARLILEPALLEKLQWQQKTYALVHEYGRRKLRAEIELLHQKIFREPAHESFRKKILQIFNLR